MDRGKKMEFDKTSENNSNNKNNKSQRKFYFIQILPILIAIIAITLFVSEYLNDEIRSEARKENKETMVGVFEETQHTLKFFDAAHLPTIALKKSLYYRSVAVDYKIQTMNTNDSLEIANNDFEVERHNMLAEYWEEEFYQELTKITGNKYLNATSEDMDQNAINDHNAFLIEQQEKREDIRAESTEHLNTAKNATKSSSNLSLSIIFFTLSSLIAGLTLDLKDKKANYVLFIIILIIFIAGFIVIGTTSFIF